MLASGNLNPNHSLIHEVNSGYSQYVLSIISWILRQALEVSTLTINLCMHCGKLGRK